VFGIGDEATFNKILEYVGVKLDIAKLATFEDQ